MLQEPSCPDVISSKKNSRSRISEDFGYVLLQKNSLLVIPKLSLFKFFLGRTDYLSSIAILMAYVRRLDDESTDVFWDSFRDKYTARPDSLERVTYPEYLAEWEVFATLSKVPQRRRDRSLVDRKERVAAPRDSK